MGKVIGICLTFIIMLTGCFNAIKGVDDTAKQAIDTSIENASSSKNQQSQSENISQNTTDININKNTTLLERIDTTKSQFEKGYYDYQGTINNNISIQMSIYPIKDEIVGTYFYEKQRKEIKLQGKAGEKSIILYEYDETGKNTGIFQGKMNSVYKIVGTWISADGKSLYPLTLSLKSIIIGAEYGKRYGLAIKNTSDQDVENFVNKIQSYVANDNKEKLAEQILYPITVKINGKATKIQNKDDVVNKYDEILYTNYKNVIINTSTKYLFTNYQGVMLGNGEMWINEVTPTGNNSKLMITAINN
ncbi:hypothetical protein [Candidatus Clostridium stratigraminis]|uniref:Lipoprotein n=1 Tax=Candidatus Clostridium stratigraminis TaxID=3381661 RepID=A0ABW8T5Z2_9CLOT